MVSHQSVTKLETETVRDKPTLGTSLLFRANPATMVLFGEIPVGLSLLLKTGHPKNRQRLTKWSVQHVQLDG